MHRLFRAVASASTVLAAVSVATTAPSVHRNGDNRLGVPTSWLHPYSRLASSTAYLTPPTTRECRQRLGRACYGPRQFRKAYDLGPLFTAGHQGQHETIAIVVSFGSPTIRRQLSVFDRAFGLPAPPHFRIIQPAGVVPPYDVTNATMRGWAQETSLDVEYAHAMAPKANLLLVETPVAETLGRHGFPRIVKAENYVINHHLAAVISQSFGATENTFDSASQIRHLRGAVKNARRNHVTMLAASGDGGATDAKTLSGGEIATYYTHRVNSWPSSDPLVTSVGGTALDLNGRGQRQRPDRVWNDTSWVGSPAAGGGGRSHVFARPAYQDSVVTRVRDRRGTPDVSLSAADDGAAIVYLSANASGQRRGFYLLGGTSLATPLFAGIVAVADEYVGRRLGFLNPLLYRLGAHPAANGLVDIRAGTNTVSFRQGGQRYTVRGFDARGGYDLSSGLGTIDAAIFIPAIARALRTGAG